MWKFRGIAACYSQIIATISRVDKTDNEIRSRYYWSRMYRDVQFKNTCQSINVTNPSAIKTGLLSSMMEAHKHIMRRGVARCVAVWRSEVGALHSQLLWLQRLGRDRRFGGLRRSAVPRIADTVVAGGVASPPPDC